MDKGSTKVESFILTVVKWLELYFIQSGQLHYAERLVKHFFRILRCRGKKEAIRFCKESRSSIYHWLITCGSLDETLRSTSRVRLPKVLRFLKHLKKVDYPFIRLILSSLYVSRGIELPPVPNVDSITRPPIKEIPDIGLYVQDFWKDLGYHHRHGVSRSVYWKRFHLSTKNGPNGQALWTAIADLSVLPDNLVDDICAIGGKRLASKIRLVRNYTSFFTKSFFKVTGSKYRKISAISDQEGKTREVALLDYWSQTALRGLHQYLFRVLRKVPQDCTFNQGGFKDKINFQGEENFHSVDLTTATDRFPIQVICQVLEGRFDRDYVKSWRNIMVGHPFDCQTGKGSEKIFYSVGNPMGAYSSWNSFAVAHHYVVYYCCRELGIKWSEAPYVLLGDDIVIKHNALAKKYMEVMTSLGVEFSLSKSHISATMFEFAKRTFHCGHEITPFPVAALWNTRKSASLLLNVIINEQTKGWTSPLGTPSVSSELYRLLKFSSTYVAKKRQIFYISHQVMMGIRGCMTAAESVRTILAEYYPDVLKHVDMCQITIEAENRVFEFWFMDMFRRSLLSSVEPRPDSKPLGLIAERLVILITGQDETLIDAFDLIQALPVLSVHGQVEETYMSVVKGGDEQFRLAMAHDWKQVLRALTIPISDQVYISRNQELLVHASFTLAKILRSIIEDVHSTDDVFKVHRKGLIRPKFDYSDLESLMVDV